MAWSEYRERFDDEHLSELSPRSAASYDVALNALERVCRPQRLCDVTTARLTHFKTKLKKEGLKPATAANYLRHVVVSLRWANRQGLLAEVPAVDPPKVTKGMKGRPITGEEFDRILGVVPKCVKPGDVEAWTFYLKGLWCSGLRLTESLTESLTVSWDRRDDAISVDLTGRRPMLRIPAAIEKGKRNRLLPMTPDFAALLLAVPECERTGSVLRVRAGTVWASELISRLGRVAGVKVSDTKFASAHDLRRAFGTRWSRKLSPARLRAIMRHQDIATTMAYYVAEESEELADALYEAEVVPTQVPGTSRSEASSVEASANAEA